MKILKKYLQNQKGLKKLDTKHVPHPPKGEKKFEAFCDIRRRNLYCNIKATFFNYCLGKQPMAQTVASLGSCAKGCGFKPG